MSTAQVVIDMLAMVGIFATSWNIGRVTARAWRNR